MGLGVESEKIEYKKSTGELNDAIIDIVAILNKQSEGVLYFGVSNNGDIIGMDVSEKTLRNISQKIYEQIKPQIYPEIITESIENKNTIKITFNGVEKPYSARGKYYIRVADESREMDPIELSKMIRNVNYKFWEKQITEETIEDVDENALQEFYVKAVKCDRIKNEEYDKNSLLTKLNLLANDRVHLNNAGKYLFSNKSPLKVKMAIFATNEKTTFIDMKKYEGNIFNAIFEVEKYIKENIKWRVEINDFQRIEIPEIPIDALREIIANSFAHANYDGQSKHEIDIHPDRIALYNPGNFPDNLTPIDFVNRNLASKIRNEIICDVLYRCKNIEEWGTGFKKTFKICEENNIDIQFEKEQEGFWFIFKRFDINGTTDNSTDKLNSSKANSDISLSEIEQLILSEIMKNPQITTAELSKLVKRSERTIQRYVKKLRANGFTSSD